MSGSTKERLALGSLWATIVISPQLFGGVFRWSAVLIAAMCIVSYGLALYAQDQVHPRTADRLLWVMAGAWLWTCVQALPLPTWLAETLHLGERPERHPLGGGG